ncbi:MAG: ComEC/Rec2 family competence protein [Candidatus Moraniibacteriota bacterium]
MEKDEVFFWGILSFIIGVACGSFFDPMFLPILLLGSAVGIAILLVFQKKEVVWCGLFFLVWWSGMWLSLEARHRAEHLPVLEETVAGTARIISDPEERDFFRRVLLRFETCESGSCPEMRVFWQAPLSFREAAGTRLSFACRLERPKNFTPEFDYQMFLAKDGIGYTCVKAERTERLAADWQGRARAFLYMPKHLIEGALSQILTEPEAGLAKGLLLGGDNYLPRALKDDFTRVGLSHMIAVSGYNIMLIAEMLLFLGLACGLWRRQAVWAALIGIIFFIIMIGMPASAARAGTMASIVFIALQTGRLARPVNALLFACAVMLLLNPLLLRYDLGFQLSFLATLGILWVVPYYERFAPRNNILKKFGEVVVMTVAVELFVLPIILFSFHTFSLLIIIGNFLVLLVPFVMVTAFVGALLFLIFPGAHMLAAWLSFGILTLITQSVEWLGSIPEASIVVEQFGIWQLLLWYVILGVGIYLLSKYVSSERYEKRI